MYTTFFATGLLDEAASYADQDGGGDEDDDDDIVCCGDGEGLDGGNGHGGIGSGFYSYSSNSGHGSFEAYYQKMIKANPGDPLILGNYARFLKVLDYAPKLVK
ncbi:hypothetical protein BVRB_9g219590 [Beta vulgaris subsp. vulgaris]|nr:hypothetical protein BVRB_9g219590 [Beta vulgaris subsp. vulgaris]